MATLPPRDDDQGDRAADASSEPTPDPAAPTELAEAQDAAPLAMWVGDASARWLINSHPAPLAADEALGTIEGWLRPTGGRGWILISGGAGSGKSALLSRWVQSLVMEEGDAGSDGLSAIDWRGAMGAGARAPSPSRPMLGAGASWTGGSVGSPWGGSLPAGGAGVFYWSFVYDADLSNFLRALTAYVGEGAPELTSDAMVGGPELANRRQLDLLLTRLSQRALPVLLALDGLEQLQLVPNAAPSFRATSGPLSRGRQLSAGHEDLHAGDPREPLLTSLLQSCVLGSANCLIVATTVARMPFVAPWRGTRCIELDLPPLPVPDASALLRENGVQGGSDVDLSQRCAEHHGHALTLRLFAGYLAAYFDGDGRAVTRDELPGSEPFLAGAELTSYPALSTLSGVLRAHLLALPPVTRHLLDLCVLLPRPPRLSELRALITEIEKAPVVTSANLWSTPGLGIGTSLAMKLGLAVGGAGVSFGAPPTAMALLPSKDQTTMDVWLPERLTELARLGLVDLVLSASRGGADGLSGGVGAAGTAGGEADPFVDIHSILRTPLYGEWLRERGGAVVDPALSHLGPLPRGESALDLLELLVRLLLSAGLADLAYAVLVQRLGGFLYHVHGLGRGRRFLSLVRQHYAVVASTAMHDPGWQARYAQLLTWEGETLRVLGQLDAALVTAQRQWPLGSTPQPQRLSQQARVLRRQGKLNQATQMAHVARQAARSPLDVAVAALELGVIELLRGDSAMCQIYLHDGSAALTEEPLLLTQPNGAELQTALELLSAQRALRLGVDGPARGALERCRAAALIRHSEYMLAMYDVAQAELLRRARSYEPAAQALHRAMTYAGRAGDMEILIAGGLAQARLRMETGHLEAASGALTAALAMAVEHSFGCYRIDLLITRGALGLRRGDVVAAERDARDALAYATAPGCSYQWGEADALHLLATVLVAGRPKLGQPRHSEAIFHLADELELRERMFDPAAPEVRWQLRRLRA